MFCSGRLDSAVPRRGRFCALFEFYPSSKKSSFRRRSHGFTMIELVMAMVIIGMLSAFLGPRFFSYDIMQGDFFATEVLNMLRYAHTVAVGSGCNVRVLVASTGYEVRRDANCVAGGAKTFSGPDSAVWPPDGSGVAGYSNFAPPENFSATLTDSDGLISGNFLYFDPDGTVRDSAGGTILRQATLVMVVGSGTHTVLIEGQTGYVRW